MKRFLVIFVFLYLCISSPCLAEEKIQTEFLQINSTHGKNEIPIELKSIQYKDFKTDSYTLEDIDISDDYKSIKLLPNIDNKKSNLITESEICYARKKSSSFFPGRWQLQTKIY